MKALIIILFLFSPFINYSQGFGIKMGLNGTANTIDIDGTKSFGAYLGFAVADSISNNFGIQVEGVFNRNGLDSRNNIGPYSLIEGAFLFRYLAGSVNFLAGPQIVVPMRRGLRLHEAFDDRGCDIIIALQIRLGETDTYLNISYNHGLTDYNRDLSIVDAYTRELKMGIDGFF